MTDYDKSIHSNPDAAAWSRFFMETYNRNQFAAPDEEMMFGWFANAMMAAHDHAARSAREEGRRDALAAIEALDEEECGGTRGITRECYAHAVRSLSASPGTGKGGDR